jgi:hypothetical protein
MIIGLPIETTVAQIEADKDAAVAAYIAAHPPSTGGGFKPGFCIVNGAVPDLVLIGYDSVNTVISSDALAIGDATSGLLRYLDAIPENLHHYVLTIPAGYSFTSSIIDADGSFHVGSYNLNADGDQIITLMRFVFDQMHLFEFITLFEKINTGDFYSTGYAEGYANYPISNPPAPVTYFLTVINTTASQIHVDFWNADGFLYSVTVPVSTNPDPYYIHDISEFPQPVHMVIHSDATYKIDTLYWVGGDGGSVNYNTVNASTIDLTSEFFERSLTQIWS